MQMTEPQVETEYVRPTGADLAALLIRWQLEADRIASMSEDVEDETLEQVCGRVFGPEGGECMMHYLVDVVGLEPSDDAFQAFERSRWA